MFSKPLNDHQYDRALRWLRNRGRRDRPPPRHIAEKIGAQRAHLKGEIEEAITR